MIKKFLYKFWPFLIILIIAFLFHIKLFYPRPSIYVTPDFGDSDLVKSKIPTQLIMWENLKKLQIPTWDNRNGQGYPKLAGLEMGFFYLPNLILFGTLPFWLAFNLSYIINTVIVATGTYLFARSFSFNKISSLVAAVTFSFSPIFSLHYHHFDFLFALSYIPWLYWLVNSFFNTKKFFYLFLIPFVVSLQYFTGSPQIATYNLFFLFVFFFLKLKGKKFNKFQQFKLLFFFLILIALGLLITSVQLFPTYEVFKKSSWLNNLDPQSVLTQFPFKPLNLTTILDPYILGNPKYGTYPTWTPNDWGIFWESNAYFGIVQLALLISCIFLIIKNKFKKYRKLYFFWTTLFTLGILFSLGKEAPFHPLFSIPPFSFFRVPSRFLFITFFAAAQISALTIHLLGKLKKENRAYLIISTLIFVFVIADIFRAWFNYNLVGDVKNWLSSPKLVENLREGRLASLYSPVLWNKTFLTKGWGNQEDNYFFYRNFLSENSNVLYNIPNLYIAEDFIPKRTTIIREFSQTDNILTNDTLQIGKISQKVLDFTNTRYITIPYKIFSKEWKLINNVEKNGDKIYLYENLNFLPHAYIVNNYEIATTRSEVYTHLSNENFDPQKSVILESDLEIDKTDQSNVEKQVNISNYQDEEVTIEAKTKNRSLLILSDSFFDGWHAYLDGEETKIYPANVNSRAIILPPGQHTIQFQYKSKYLIRGACISIAAFLASVLIFLKFRSKKIRFSRYPK